MRTFGELLIDCGEDRTRFLAEHIPDATLVELPGDDALPWIGAAEPVLNEIEKAVTGEVRAKRAGAERVLGRGRAHPPRWLIRLSVEPYAFAAFV